MGEADADGWRTDPRHPANQLGELKKGGLKVLRLAVPISGLKKRRQRISFEIEMMDGWRR